MADWADPTVDSLYTDFVDEVKDRDLDVAKMMDSATVTVTNPTSGMKRWNDSNSNWEEWNGSTWVALTATYGISISGTAGAVAFANVTGTPTTLSGYGITDAQGLDADLTALAGLATTGLIVRTGAGTAVTRSLTAPAAGLTITNADGVSGAPTFVLANDLLALESLSSTGLAARTATSTWVERTITGTANRISVTNGNGVSGNPTLDVGSSVATLNTEDQALTGGVIVTSKSLGTISSGTVTPDPGDRPQQHYTNGGAHTLAPSSNHGSYLLDITNDASAGAITTSGWTKVTGDSFTTTDTHKFRCHCSIGQVGSLLNVQAMQ